MDEVVYLNQKNFKNFSFRISNEYLKTSPVAFYFPKNSFLVEAFNEKISFLKSAGLIDFWISKHMDLKYVKVKEADVGARSLKFMQLKGIFWIWFFGCMLSSLIFIAEFLRFKMRCKVQIA